MKNRSRSLARFWADCVFLGVESQAVIGLRLAKIAWGNAGSHTEARRMVQEKMVAVIDAQKKVAADVMSGKAHLAPGDIVRLYRGRVRRNRKRLTRGH